MDKLKMHSPNLVEQNIEKLAALFPNCVTEAKGEDGSLKKTIDFDLLKQELSRHIVDGPQERYHLNWPGKREALLTANAPIAKTLRPCREESVNFDTTQNLFIEGDNLDALKLLQETYLGKVKMIYIDPPYNTGKDFVYADDFAENSEIYFKESGQRDASGNRLIANTESNGRFHSDWLSMMYSRLKLAKNLLSDDGVIFISIDDNEFMNLKKIGDEVFGEINYLGTISNTNNPKGRSDDKFIATAHEYIAVYSKNVNEAIVHGFEPDEVITKRYNKYDENNKCYREIDLRKTGDSDRREDRPDMFYYFYFNEEKSLLRVSKNKESINDEIEIIPLKDDNSFGRWRWGFNTAQENLNLLYAKIMPSRKIWGIFEKDYLDGRPPVKATSSWTFKDVNSERGSEQFIELGFDKEVFQRPKPVGTLKRCLEVGTKPDSESLVMDFFAGSGSFAQAVFELNSENRRNLKFILVQLPEKCDANSRAFKDGYDTIAEITKERMRRSGKIRINSLAPSDEQQDIGFRVLKVDSSNMSEVYYNPDSVLQGDLFTQVENVKEDRTEEDLLFQVMLDWGVDLTLPIHRETIANKIVFFVAAQPDNTHGALVACFDKDGGIDEAFIKQLAAYNPLRLVFRDAGFASDAAKINVEQLLKQLSPTTDVKTI